MPSSLPLEVIHLVIEHAVANAFAEAFAAHGTLGAMRPPVDFLLVASVVHSTWRRLAQDLLLRHTPITKFNYEDYLERIIARGEAFAKTIRFLRVLGAADRRRIPSDYSDFDYEHFYTEAQESTEVLAKVLRALPELREVEAVRWAVSDLPWASEHPHVASVSFVGCDVLPLPVDRSGGELPSYSIPRLRFEQHPESTASAMPQTLWCLCTLFLVRELEELSMEHIVGEMTSLADALCPIVWPAPNNALATVRHLRIGDGWIGRPSTPHDSRPWWTYLASLEHLTAPLSILPTYDKSDTADPMAHLPLPPTLRSLTFRPITPSTHHRLCAADHFTFRDGPRSKPAANPVANSVGGARIILACAVEELQHLESLGVDKVLLSRRLVEHCRERKIKLSVWV